MITCGGSADGGDVEIVVVDVWRAGWWVLAA